MLKIFTSIDHETNTSERLSSYGCIRHGIKDSLVVFSIESGGAPQRAQALGFLLGNKPNTQWEQKWEEKPILPFKQVTN